MRHIDFPASDGTDELRRIAGYSFEARDVRYHESRNFMDTWHLFRAVLDEQELDKYIAQVALEPAGDVEYFDLIISRPPPYWWHPERLPRARLYEGNDRDGRAITVMYDRDSRTAYMLVY